MQRRGSTTGVIVVCDQKIPLGSTHAGETFTIAVSDTALAIEPGDQEPHRAPRQHAGA